MALAAPLDDATARAALREGRAVLLDKPLGATPLEALEALCARDPRYATRTLGYAGRLDPLATGLLLLLCDDENRGPASERWRALDKGYTAQVLLGASTDAGDALGLVTAVRPVADAAALAALHEALAAAARPLVGPFVQPVPRFAAHRVRGRSLWSYARAGETPPGGWPAYPREVYALRVEGLEELRGALVRDGALARVDAVTRGDFRQGALRARWREALAGSALERARFVVATVSLRCSSGTFVRPLAEQLGAALGYPALAWSLRRTTLGPFTLDDAAPPTP